jgi:hypothetical protein
VLKKKAFARRLAGTLVLLCPVLLLARPLCCQPRIEFEETVYDWGRVLEGESVNHVFRFRNAGSELLVVPARKVISTCGCTAALVSSERLKPGESGEVRVTFDSRGRVGPQHKAVTIVSNDPEHPTLRLDVKGEVYMILRPSPRSLNFGEVELGTSKTKTVTVTPWSGVEFQIREIVPPGEYFRALEVRPANTWIRFVQTVRDRMVMKFGSDESKSELETRSKGIDLEELGAGVENSKTVAVTILPTAPVGRHVGSLKIVTDVEERPSVDVWVYASVVGDLEVTPKNHNFGDIRRGEREETSFTIYNRGKRAIEITGVESSSRYTRVELTEVAPGREYRIRLRLLPDVPLGKLRGTVTAATTDKDEPTVEFSFYGSVR